jgi:hypothetical protein
MRRLTRLGLLLAFVALACACGGGGSTSTSGPLPAGPTAPATASATATPTSHASATPSASPHPSTSPTATATPTASPSASPAATNGPALTINVATGRQAISNDIYGVTIFWTSSLSSTYNTFAAAIRLPANRYGGDATTRYNWQVDSSNAGSDWYFMAGNGQSSVTPGASVDYIVNVNKGLGTKSIITVPIIDYINKQAATNCSYPNPPVTNQVPFNGNPAYNPYVTLDGGAVQCGSGSNAAGYINDTTPTATDVANTPAIQQAWVTHMVSKWGQGASGGVPIYELDNEPNGWIAVHHDVRPQNIGYHELFNKSLAMAKAIKAADPTALVLGPDDIPPADEGCNNGNPSNVSTGTCNNDGASQNGNTPLGLWYLQQFATQSPRMLDYYAMHYPGACCFATNGTLADMVAAIQRHKGWIASAYPGTKLAYDEWNRGTGNGFAVALATADGLGVMGQQGVDLASFWGLDPTYPSAYAFLMFRNYDGHGSGFGETSVTATSADTTKLTVYAAQRSADNAVTIIVVNSTSTAWTSAVSLSGVTVQQKAPTYQYTSANASAIVAGSTITPSGSTLVVTFPANSITMIVQPSGSQALSSRRR